MSLTKNGRRKEHFKRYNPASSPRNLDSVLISSCNRHDFFSRRDLAKHERTCREIEKKQMCYKEEDTQHKLLQGYK